MPKFNFNKYFENQERILINNFKRKEEVAKISKEPKNVRLKYIAIGMLSIGIILEFIILIWMDVLSDRAILWLQGFTGVFAIIFVILTSILLFRINNKYNKQKYNKTDKY